MLNQLSFDIRCSINNVNIFKSRVKKFFYRDVLIEYFCPYLKCILRIYSLFV